MHFLYILSTVAQSTFFTPTQGDFEMQCEK